jgi:hypothetical protein
LRPVWVQLNATYSLDFKINWRHNDQNFKELKLKYKSATNAAKAKGMTTIKFDFLKFPRPTAYSSKHIEFYLA